MLIGNTDKLAFQIHNINKSYVDMTVLINNEPINSNDTTFLYSLLTSSIKSEIENLEIFDYRLPFEATNLNDNDTFNLLFNFYDEYRILDFDRSIHQLNSFLIEKESEYCILTSSLESYDRINSNIGSSVVHSLIISKLELSDVLKLLLSYLELISDVSQKFHSSCQNS